MTNGPTPPFGSFAPGPLAGAIHRLARRLPDGIAFRHVQSLLLSLAGGRSGRAFDVAVFDTEKARLHPHDNICEKRVFISPKRWEIRERTLLADFIARGTGPLTFVDAGANAGLFALYAASVARAAARAIRIVAIEPAAEMRARMAFNFEASGVDATILPWAATAAPGPVGLAINLKNRGMSRVVETGEEPVEGKPLRAILDECGLCAVDAMKVDIEGGEFAALSAFFRDAPKTQWPTLLLIETVRDEPARSAKSLILENGYAMKLETKMNTVFERRP